MNFWNEKGLETEGRREDKRRRQKGEGSKPRGTVSGQGIRGNTDAHRIPRYTVLPARHQRGNNLVGNDPDQNGRKIRKAGVLLDCRLEPALRQGVVHGQTALDARNESSRTRSTETRSLGPTGARKTRLESGCIELSDRNVTLDTLGLGRNTANVKETSATGSNANDSLGSNRGAGGVPARPLTATRPVEYKAFLALFDREH